MATARRQILDWEERFFPLAGLAALVATALIVASSFVASSITQNGHASDLLVSAHENGSSLYLYAGMQAVGYLLLGVPLYFLFRATAARSDRFRRQMVGVVIAAPIFFAIAAILTASVTTSAADAYANGEATAKMTKAEAAKECREELKDKGSKEFGEEWDEGGDPTANCEQKELDDDKAEQAISSQGLHGLSFGFELASRLGYAAALLYTCLYAMRVGLLTRFWGSLGMALGVAALVLAPIFSLIFFIYFALLCFGFLPGGRPPAWAAGEAVAWPTPGEKAARELEPEDPRDEPVHDPELEEGDGEEPQGPGPGRKKRKRRR